MFYFSEKSLKKLYKCHPILVELMLYSIRTTEDDFSIICGFRSDKDQQKAYENGKSERKAGESNHNKKPALAVDIATYPIPRTKKEWHDAIPTFIEIGHHIQECAAFLDIPIIWGGDWEMGDYGHFELNGEI
jgi:hypothetical protein